MAKVATELLEHSGHAYNHHTLDMSHIATFDNSPTPLVLSFARLTYAVDPRPNLPLIPTRTRSKTILHDLSGSARDGHITAILGPSGSGKSTLIDALAGRISTLLGSISLNGERLDPGLASSISAYVMQSDLLHPMLTVRETLTFAADLRLPRSLSRACKRARVESAIDQLGLRAAADTVVGDETRRGISGGERRRVSVGTDIIHDPVLLFLDEPTSGLDSTGAFMLVKVLRGIARSGSVVVMSVHQPSSRILGLLDCVILLSRGRAVYNGPPSEMARFFADFGRPILDGENRAEFALDLIRELEESPDKAGSLVEYFNRDRETTLTGGSDPPGHGSLEEAISGSISRGKLVSGAGGRASLFANPIWAELAVLCKRSFVNSRRMPELIGVRLATVMVTGFILATVFWRLDYSPRGVQERLGFFAFAVSTTYYACVDALPFFLHERHIFMKETAYNAYRRSSYVISHALMSLPPLVFLSAAFAATTFWSVGLGGSFPFYLAIVLASFWAGNSFVTFLSGAVSHVMLGYVTAAAAFGYYLLLSGFFVNRDRVPVYWLWFHYSSLVKYPYEGALINEFGGRGKCFVRGAQVFDGTPLAGLAEGVKLRVLESVNVSAETCVTTGADVLARQGITELSKWNCLWVTVAWGVFFRVLFYLALLLGSNNKRR